MDAAGEIARVVDVPDASETHSSLQFWLANHGPLIDILKTLAHLLVIVSVFGLACLTAVVYLFAPITGQMHRVV